MRRVWLLIAAALGAAIAADLALGVSPPGLVAAFGFVAGVVLIFGSKALGAWVVGAPEDYYRDDDEEDTETEGGGRGTASDGDDGGEGGGG